MLKKRTIISLFSFIALYNISSVFNFELVRYVAVIPLLFIFAQNYSLKKTTLLVWLAGFLALLWQYSSTLHLLPLDWLGIESTFVGALIIIGFWIFFSFFLSISFLPLLFARLNMWFMPFLWVVSEYVRSWLYSLFVLGPSSTVGDHFSYGFLGYTASGSTTLLALAPHLGVYGLSLLIVLVNCILYFFFIRRNEGVKYKVFLGLLILLLVVSEFVALVPQRQIDGENEIRVVAVQNNNPVRFYYDDSYFLQTAGINENIIKEALIEYPDTRVVVLSENSQLIETLAQKNNQSRKDVVHNLLGEDTERVLIEGHYDPSRDASLAVFNSPQGTQQAVEKDLLMPFGEYQPHILEVLAHLLGRGDWFDSVVAQKNTQRIEAKNKTVSTPAGDISAVACSEILSFSTYEKIQKEDPDFIVHQQRLAHFHGNKKLFNDSLRVSQLRAAILGKYIIGAVDSSGYSYIINPRGEIVEIGDDSSTYVTGVISI